MFSPVHPSEQKPLNFPGKMTMRLSSFRIPVAVIGLTMMAGTLSSPAFAVEAGFNDKSWSKGGWGTNKAQIWWGRGQKPDRFACSGAVINHNKVLTAAHCLPKGEGTSLFVYTNRLYLKQGDLHTVIHTDRHHDLAVLTLNSDVHIDDKHLLKADGNPAAPKRGEKLQVWGWGKTCEYCGPARQLKGLNVVTIGTEASDGFGGPAFGTRPITVRGPFGAKLPIGPIMKGDSGGPVTVWRNHHEALIGVTSAVRGGTARHSMISGDNYKWLKMQGLMNN